jgi:NADPH-dependent curcumin reductase CurA
MPERRNREWRLKRRPVGMVQPSDFALTDGPIPDLDDGQILVRNVYLSIDPTQRIWAGEEASYLPPVELGDVMRGIAVAVVEQSRNQKFPVGMAVSGLFGMQDYAVSKGEGVNPLPPGVPLQAGLAVFSHIGITAYFGLLEIGQAKAGETLVVSGAGGAVGSLVGQIGKIVGCSVIGIAGSDDKCRWITRELGFDGAINYRSEDVGAGLDRLCPGGIDVYFDNVGGEILDLALTRLKLHARIPLCGGISQYNATGKPRGPANLMHLVYKRARMEGFLTADYRGRPAEAMKPLAVWLKEGRIKYRVDVVTGLENAIAAMQRMYEGGNIGKLLVQVSDEPSTANSQD